MSISYDDNHYTTGTSTIMNLIIIFHFTRCEFFTPVLIGSFFSEDQVTAKLPLLFKFLQCILVNLGSAVVSRVSILLLISSSSNLFSSIFVIILRALITIDVSWYYYHHYYYSNFYTPVIWASFNEWKDFFELRRVPWESFKKCGEFFDQGESHEVIKNEGLFWSRKVSWESFNKCGEFFDQGESYESHSINVEDLFDQGECHKVFQKIKVCPCVGVH